MLTSDLPMVEALRHANYRETSRRVLMHRGLAGFRAPVDVKLMQVRRKFQVSQAIEAQPDNWWQACVWSHAEWSRYHLTLKNGTEPIISATFWEVLPLSRGWGVRTMGLVQLDDTPEAREEGLSTFLLGEILRQMQAGGIAQVEVQAAENDATLIEIFSQLGFTKYDCGTLFCKAETC